MAIFEKLDLDKTKQTYIEMSDGKMYKKIYSWNQTGLRYLWDTVRYQHSTKEETLEALYKTYSKEQWDMKCKKFKFFNYN